MLSSDCPVVPLAAVLTQVWESAEIRDDQRYKQVTVRLHNKGLVLRQEALGREVKTKQQYQVRSGQFAYSRIDARNGAMGIVPPDLDGAIVSNDFPVFDIHSDRLAPRFLSYYVSTEPFLEKCLAASSGTTNRRRLKEANFLSITIPLPPLDEQRRIVARIEGLANRIEETKGLQYEVDANLGSLLLQAYDAIVADAPRLSVSEIAPLVRRRVEVVPSDVYLEVGIRSFGKGAFHKPAVDGASLGDKRVFRVEPGDLLFNIVFAWEGAVAVARPEDQGRVGSHRFLTCVPKPGVATPSFLCFHFLTDHGLDQLGQASPGAAGRNRTLGIQALGKIEVPVPAFEKQLWFDSISSRVDSVKTLHAHCFTEMEAMLKSVLNRAFRGEL